MGYWGNHIYTDQVQDKVHHEYKIELLQQMCKETTSVALRKK